jgi:hypothetical protein
MAVCKVFAICSGVCDADVLLEFVFFAFAANIREGEIPKLSAIIMILPTLR